MSDYQYMRCKKCGEFGWAGSHRCTEFTAKIPEWFGEEEYSCWAHDHQTAAERLTELQDDEHTLCTHGRTLVVHVRVAGDDESPWRLFEVEAEAVVEYHACEMKGE